MSKQGFISVLGRLLTWSGFSIALVAALVMVFVPGPATLVVSADHGGSEPCHGGFQGGGGEGTLDKTTVPPGGSEANPAPITPGATVNVTISWAPSEWNSLDQLFDCVSFNGALQGPPAEFEEKPPVNDGIATHSYTVPTTFGTIVCDRARLSGNPAPGTGTTLKSNTVCFVVTMPPTATSVPPTATSVPPTATSVPPTATSVPPTATSVPPTATSVPPTATSVPPTATSVPPTGTSVPPTATSVPPTATSVPPATTSEPAASPPSAPAPAATPTAVTQVLGVTEILATPPIAITQVLAAPPTALPKAGGIPVGLLAGQMLGLTLLGLGWALRR